VQIFSRLVLDLYRAARETPLAQFQDAALCLIKPLLKFDSAVWGAVDATQRRIEMHHVHLHNEPAELISAYLEVQHQDHAARALMKNRKLTVLKFSSRVMYAGRDKRGIRDYTRRFRHENALLAGEVSAADNLSRWLSLWRASADRQYTEKERRLCRLLFPHLLEALAVNRIAHLEQTDLASGKKHHSLAIADRKGVLYYRDSDFARILQEEFSALSGRMLPDALVAALTRDRRYAGRSAIFAARLEDDLLFLKARPRVAADGLTPREVAIARQISHGGSYKEIASTMGIAPATVRNHIQSIHEKLGVGGKAEVIAQLNLAD
jgi:DNA-binding CsgD family transcriptional regulator